MKYKVGLVITCILIILFVSCFIDYKNNLKEKEVVESPRTKIEYIFDNMSFKEALTVGEEKFLKTIKLVANDYFEYKMDIDDSFKKYYINNDYYIEVINYGKVKEFLNKQSIEEYNNLVNYLYFENKDYVKQYTKNINEKYVGSILSISSYDNEEIRYQVKNYYCNDYHFVGILKEEPECIIESITDSYFTLVKEGSILKIKDLNEFINNKIY